MSGITQAHKTKVSDVIYQNCVIHLHFYLVRLFSLSNWAIRFTYKWLGVVSQYLEPDKNKSSCLKLLWVIASMTEQVCPCPCLCMCSSMYDEIVFQFQTNFSGVTKCWRVNVSSKNFFLFKTNARQSSIY